jgi:hypothetical protein
VLTAPTEPHWFDFVDFLKTNRTKSNRIYFYLAVKMIFMLKTEPNCTAITLDKPLIFHEQDSPNI